MTKKKEMLDMKRIFWVAALIIFVTTLACAAVIKPGEIKIPSEYGRVTERFEGSQGKLIVHVQDAHTNYEAQKNSAGIIEDLINKQGLYLILVEGGSRDVSLNHYRAEMSLDERKKMAEESLKNGVIAGEEYLNIASDYPMKLQGIEDRVLYDDNMKAFLEIDKDKDGALLFTMFLSGIVSSLKPKLYNQQLKELDEKRIGFKEEKITLNEYAEYLNDLAGRRSSSKKNWISRLWRMILTFLSRIGLIKYTPPAKINLSLYPNYQGLMESIALEKEIDFAAVEKERAQVIDTLSKKVKQDDLNELLTKSVDFKSGKLTQAQYHNYLKETMAKAQVAINKYPNLERYVRYITTYENIDSAGLFKELKLIEDAVERPLVSNEEQGRFVRLVKNLGLLIDFINLKLAPDDFDYYLKNEGDFDVDVWIRFLNDQSARFKLAQRAPENAQVIERIIPSLKSFYAIARKRDAVFLNNTKKYMDAEGVNIAVLIAGGFHTPNLMKLFREDKISYIVVAPKVVKPTDEKLYHKILTEGWAPAGER